MPLACLAALCLSGTVAIDGDVIIVNGHKVVFRGVNRHEWDPHTGRTLDEETMRADLELMKRHGVNAIRTSHYPPDARFLDLRRRRTEAFVERNARAIADLQARGLADPELDPSTAAMALSGMVSRLAGDAFLFGITDIDPLVDTATRLWTNALGLTRPNLDHQE